VLHDRRLVVVLLVRHRDLVDHQGRALRMLFQVFAVLRIARDDDRPSVVVHAIAVGGLDQIAVVHLERRHFHAVPVIDHPVIGVVRRRNGHAFHRVFLVGIADADIVRIGAFEVLHQRHGAGRPDDAERVFAVAVVALNPAGQPQVGNAGRVVGMKVRQEHRIQCADGHADLVEPDGGATTDVEQKLLLAGLHQRRGAEAIGNREGRAGPEQRHLEILRPCPRGSRDAGGEKREAPTDAHAKSPGTLPTTFVKCSRDPAAGVGQASWLLAGLVRPPSTPISNPEGVTTMHSPILAPLVALVLWSLVMWIWLYATRIPAIRRNRIALDPRRPPAEFHAQLPPEVRWKADNYNHLMEQPTLFYAVVLTLAFVGAGA